MLDHCISPGSHEKNPCLTELVQLELSDVKDIFGCAGASAAASKGQQKLVITLSPTPRRNVIQLLTPVLKLTKHNTDIIDKH